MEAHVSVSSLGVGAVLRAVVAEGCGAHLGGEVRRVRGAVVQMRRADLEVGPDAVHDEGQDPLVRDEVEERGVVRQAVADLEAAPARRTGGSVSTEPALTYVRGAYPPLRSWWVGASAMAVGRARYVPRVHTPPRPRVLQRHLVAEAAYRVPRRGDEAGVLGFGEGVVHQKIWHAAAWPSSGEWGGVEWDRELQRTAEFVPVAPLRWRHAARGRHLKPPSARGKDVDLGWASRVDGEQPAASPAAGTNSSEFL